MEILRLESLVVLVLINWQSNYSSVLLEIYSREFKN